MSEPVVAAFVAAGEWFQGIAGRDEIADRWGERSALDGYTVGGIVGHITAAVAWLGPLLDTTAPDSDVPVWSVGDYLAPFPVRTAEDLNGPLHVATRAQGERVAERGPKETVAKLHSRLEDVAERVMAADLHRLLDLRPTLPAAIPVGDFLRTRVVELVVHGDDLAVSIDLSVDPPDDAGAIAANALLAAAIHKHGHLELLRALARGERSTGGLFPVL